ncbi:hypothetical protein [Streptosporangium sp. NPDC051022]|uniref:hypothetical protein n=1 Tax=Streptosporangium sp. NPDC051022 TaxID=3155752 RepID=UPI003445B4D9
MGRGPAVVPGDHSGRLDREGDPLAAGAGDILCQEFVPAGHRGRSPDDVRPGLRDAPGAGGRAGGAVRRNPASIGRLTREAVGR